MTSITLSRYYALNILEANLIKESLMALHPAPQKDPLYSVTVSTKDGLEKKCADPKATRSLLALMNLHAVNGGAACHWGGPAAMAESMSALHEIMFQTENWFEKYNFVNDIGHAENGIYALRALHGFGGLSFDDLKGFRSLDSKLTGHGESHLYPEGVLLSNGPLGSSLPQAQGLAMADKHSNNDRITINSISDGACMEGEAKEALAAIPGLHQKGLINPFLLIVSDNQTKLSGRMIDAFDMAPTFNSLGSLGWKIIEVEKGNDLQACYTAIEQGLESAKSQPTCLRLKTIKGYGIKSTEDSASGGHGFPLKKYDAGITEFIKELWEGNAPEEFLSWAEALTKAPESSSSGPKKEKAQAGFGRALNRLKAEGFKLVSLSSDLQGSTGMAPFHKENPGDSFDLGIAESNMISTAAGWSKAGYIPLVDTFSAFGITKGNLPLIMASLSNCPMIAVFSHTGFQDAADGASHQSLTYFSAIASIPNVEIICVSTSEEAEVLMEQAVRKLDADKKAGHGTSYVFFVGRENFIPSLETVDPVKSWDDQLVVKGKDVLIAATGPLLHEALGAREILASRGIDAGIINHRFLNKINAQKYVNLLKQHNGHIITVEDHQVAGGIGSFLIHQITQADPSVLRKVTSLGVKGVFGQSAYQAAHLYQKHGLDAQSIASVIKA